MEVQLKQEKAMARNRLSKLKSPGMATLLFGVLCCFFSIFHQPYRDIDNYWISVVVNGLFSNDFYCCHLNPVLCVICRAGAVLFPATDTFATLGAGMVLICLCWLFYLFLILRINRDERFVFILLLIGISFGDNFFNANYTIQAALFATTGAITLGLVLRGHLQKHWYVAIGTLLLCCGAMWRVKAFLLMMPFLLLDVVFVFIRRATGPNKDFSIDTKKLMSTYLPAFLSILLLVGISEGVRHTSRYAEAVRYNEARESVNDYPIKNWEEVQDELPQMTSQDYQALDNWLLADTDIINVEYLEQVAAVAATTAYTASISSLIPMTLELVIRIARLGLLAAVLAAMFVLMMLQRDWLVKLEVLFAYGGAYLCGLYFVFRGRLPQRVSIPIALSLLFVIFMLVIENKKSPIIDLGKWQMVGLACVVLGLAGFKMQLVSPLTAPNIGVWTAKTNVDDSAWMTAEMPEDALFIWRGGGIVSTFWKQGKLPTKEVLQHNISDGDWLYGQVYYQEHLESINAANPAKALLTRENTYYAATDCTDMLIYLQEHFSATVSAEQVGEKFGVPVWKFTE